MASAKALAEAGANVILMARRSEVLEQVRQTLPNAQNHRTLALDQERLEDVSVAISRLAAEVGPISVWVNNTGGPKPGLLADASPDEMERAFRQHVLASQVILRAILPGMKQQKWGRIINVLSTSVKVPIPNLGVSNTIRGAMASWAKTISYELGPFGITVNNILPGFTETPRMAVITSGAAQREGKSEQQVKEEMAQGVPLKRWAEPSETADAILYFASPSAGYISGVSLAVDGGRTPSL
jgi:3-oxoacyl-[acyl-carrier protein] reductase